LLLLVFFSIVVGAISVGLFQEFKSFAMRGNVIDLAVGVVIGGAFGKIINSLVENIFMTPLNLVTAKSGVNFNGLSLKYSHLTGGKIELPVLKKDGTPELDASGNAVMNLTDPDILKYGPFIQTTFEFIIIAFALFMVIKVMNRLKKKEESVPAATPEDVLLLREIRDSLAKTAPRRAD
jgi:large conductance mechanosensitive channel